MAVIAAPGTNRVGDRPLIRGAAVYPAGILLLFGLAWLGRLGILGQDRGAFLLAYVLATAGYLLFLRIAAPSVFGRFGNRPNSDPAQTLVEESPKRPRDSRSRTFRLAWVLCVAVAARLLVMGIPASDDVYRYLWEGRAQSVGINPYLTSPSVGASLTPADPYAERINHPEWTTIYPPAAQLLFRMAVVLSYKLETWKWLCLVADLALIGVIWLWIRSRGRPVHHVGIYAWHPLPVLAFAGEGHLDVWMLLALVSAFVALRAGRSIWAALAWTFAVGFKFVPAALFFLFARARWWTFLGVSLAAALLLALPFRDAGVGFVSSLFGFGLKLGHNSPAYWAAESLGSVGRWMLLLGFALATAWCSWRSRRDPERGAFLVLGWFLALSPTVHPWYLTWMIPLLIRFPSQPWVYLSLAAGLAYLAYGYQAETGAFHLPPVWTLVQFVPFYLLALRGEFRSPRGATAA